VKTKCQLLQGEKTKNKERHEGSSRQETVVSESEDETTEGPFKANPIKTNATDGRYGRIKKKNENETESKGEGQARVKRISNVSGKTIHGVFY